MGDRVLSVLADIPHRIVQIVTAEVHITEVKLGIPDKIGAYNTTAAGNRRIALPIYDVSPHCQEAAYQATIQKLVHTKSVCCVVWDIKDYAFAKYEKCKITVLVSYKILYSAWA
jgi:hypothetical protein